MLAAAKNAVYRHDGSFAVLLKLPARPSPAVYLFAADPKAYDPWDQVQRHGKRVLFFVQGKHHTAVSLKSLSIRKSFVVRMDFRLSPEIH